MVELVHLHMVGEREMQDVAVTEGEKAQDILEDNRVIQIRELDIIEINFDISWLLVGHFHNLCI